MKEESIKQINGKLMLRYFVLLVGCVSFLLGCSGLQVNVPVKFQTIPREEAALVVLLENRSSLQIKITYPIRGGLIEPSQYVVFSLPKPGNYSLVVAAYEESHKYRYRYRQVATVEIPVFLNGYDVFNVRGRLVGHYIQVTDGMFLSGR